MCYYPDLTNNIIVTLASDLRNRKQNVSQVESKLSLCPCGPPSDSLTRPLLPPAVVTSCHYYRNDSYSPVHSSWLPYHISIMNIPNLNVSLLVILEKNLILRSCCCEHVYISFRFQVVQGLLFEELVKISAVTSSLFTCVLYTFAHSWYCQSLHFGRCYECKARDHCCFPSFHSFFFFFFFKTTLYWSVIDLWCVNFRCTAKWLSYTICIYFLSDSFSL